jgi:hypothetical protein
MDNSAVDQMLDSGMLRRVGADSIDEVLQDERLLVLLFAGGKSQRGDAHDVAVALREILRDYPGLVTAGLVEEPDAAALQPRFRILVSPSLALVRGGMTLEVIPRVRDWADYSRVFQRYLGAPSRLTATEARA